ncbi:uncharacterized protein [Haliotis cracherodii]|uniref:uncharacterized protein n=1 Tax=Haliotis cracherodii TaxID=6455 RepID=UPI0039EC3DCD
MAESASCSQPNSKIIFEVTLDTDEVEFEIKNEDNPTWTHTTKWYCDVVPPTLDLQIHKEMYRIRKLHQSFYDCLDVTLTSTLNRNRRLMFAFRHDTLDHAIQMAARFTDVQATFLQFTQDIDAKVENIKLRVTGGDQNGSTEQDNTRTDEGSIKAGSVLYSAPDKCDGYVAETDWTCTFDHDATDIDLTSSLFTRLKILFQDKYRCILKRVRRGSLIFEYRHESQEAALEMMRDHVKVKDTILKCIQETDPRVHAIKVAFGYKEIKEKKRAPGPDTGREPGSRDTPQGSDQPGGASSHPSKMEALRPGATHATSREEETRKSGTPLGPGTRATPTPARRDRRADRDLLEASRKGNMAAVKQILAAGRADVNCRDEVGWTPVMRAAYKGHRDVVELLVSEGADVSLVDEDGDNTLHFACWRGDVETVKFVLSLHVADINSRGGRSRTPVMEAALGGHRDVVELLVSEGADVSLVDEDGDNTLHFACWRGDVETVKFVLSLHVADINSRGGRSRTPVMWAAWRGHRDVVELLVSEGADVSLVDEYGDNILHWACWGGDVETVKCVLSLNVVDIDARNNDGQTAADVARRRGHQEVVKLL